MPSPTSRKPAAPGDMQALGRMALGFAGLFIAQRALGGAEPMSPDLRARRDAERRQRNNADGDKPQSHAGRGADEPTEIPARGWKEIFWRVSAQIGEDRVLAVAAGVTFYALLAIFPAITALVSVYGLFSDPSSIQRHLATVSAFMPGGAIDIIGEQVQRIASEKSGLSFAFALGLATSIWSANAGMKALFDALNVAYGEKEKRGFIALNATSLAFTAGMLIFAVVALAAAVGVPIVLAWFPLGTWLSLALNWLRWPLLLVLLALALALLYRFGPTLKKPQWRWISVGSAFASITWVIASAAFSYYAANFGSYNKTYGTLGAAIGFMTWIWISVIVIMIGAEINSEVEAQAEGESRDDEAAR
jgi:membrane protein